MPDMWETDENQQTQLVSELTGHNVDTLTYHMMAAAAMNHCCNVH